jgi:hypothetical protein
MFSVAPPSGAVTAFGETESSPSPTPLAARGSDVPHMRQ